MLNHRVNYEVNMKTFFKKFLLLTSITVLICLLACFTLSSLTKSGIMETDVSDLILQILGILVFFFYSFFLGTIIKKRGWLIGLGLALVYGVVAYSIRGANSTLDLLSGIMISLRVLSLFLGPIVGVNFKSKK